jgi:transcriptional regulator with XRE-family HTH domain
VVITAAQIRAARELIKWSQSKLTAETDVSLASIAKFEGGGQRPSMLDLSVVQRMLKDAGVEFIKRRGKSEAEAQMTESGTPRDSREEGRQRRLTIQLIGLASHSDCKVPGDGNISHIYPRGRPADCH